MRILEKIKGILKIQSSLFIILGFIAFVFLTVYFLNDFYSEPPFDLFGLEDSIHIE